ncbi:DUF2335 domain-containing protein [Nitratireductor rhodophyticola]|uniref:DUF2335 domain-containing protein n=1 Tax=Nitratireductor rhodophyticola TaxID=2854036 RepID=UPI003BAC8671
MKKPANKSPAPQNNSGQLQQKLSIQTAWQGPLPKPEDLEEYGRIVNNGAERIVVAWEIESEHRRKMDKRDLTLFHFNAILGKVFAFLFVIGALGLSAWALYLDRPWVAGILSASTIAIVVGAFIEVEKRKKA